MKTEHELLKEICDKIGYIKYGKKENAEIRFDTYVNRFEIYHCHSSVEINVREIIFTQEFMNLYLSYLFKDSKIDITSYRNGFYSKLMGNLDNPVKYLANLLGIGKQDKN